MNTLELSQISKSYASTRVLEHIDLQVAAGSRTAIVGASGSGKTTLLRIIAGFETPDRGEIILAGQSVVSQKKWLPAHQRKIGFMSQEGALFPHFTVAENISYGLTGTKKEKKRRIHQLMEMVALDHAFLSLWPHELSGGQQQRVALARALSQQPVLMLLDEPFSALDTALRESTRKAVVELLCAANVATILVTHDQHEALSFADQVAVMQSGRLAQVGAPQALYLHPADQPTATFLGEALILSARIEKGIGICLLGEFKVNDLQTYGVMPIMLRPEQIQVMAISPERAQQARCLAKVIDIDFAGFVSTLLLEVGSNKETLALKTISNQSITLNTLVDVSIIGSAHVFPHY